MWPALSEPAVAVPKDQLRQELEAPWLGGTEPPPGSPLLRAGRMLAGAPGDFPSLEAAFAAAAPGAVSVIEVHDNGPLYLTPLSLVGRSAVVRAGKGYRPLLVWDAPGSPQGRGTVLLSATRGHLTLEGLDLAVRWSDAAEPERLYFARVTDGDFLARDCTFSVAGRHTAGVGVVRFDRSDAAGPPRSGGHRCRLSRCYARGTNLVALDADSPGGEVLLDGCLIVGTDQPLLQVTGRNLSLTTLRVARSTLACGQTVLEVRPGGAGETLPQVHWRAWDALLTRAGGHPGGEMVALPGGARTTRMRWQAVNSLYAGWKSLLSATDSAAHDTRSWRACWGSTEGEEAVSQPWPAVLEQDPSERLADGYQPTPFPGSPVGYAATSGPGPLGCDLSALPPARGNWLALALDGFPVPAVDLLADAAPPLIPSALDGRYHGGRIDLSRTDLGAFLEEVQKKQPLGPRVVLRLAGNGEHRTRPVRVKGSTLVLHFEPADRDGPPPVLLPHDTVRADGEALIEVDGGSLELVGAGIRFPDYRLALLPPYQVSVRGGDLRLFRCRLHGPLLKAPDGYRGLIRFEGAGEGGAARGCAVNETVLVTGKAGVHLSGSGARLRLRQSVLLCGTDAVHVEPGAGRPRLDLTCFLENVTAAAQRAAFRLGDVPEGSTGTDPVVVHARACAFLNPFAPPAPAPAVLAVDGNALGRGLLVWQGEGNVYDKRLAGEVLSLPHGGGSARPETGPKWASLWDTAWRRRQTWELPVTATVDWDGPDPSRLTLPAVPGLPRGESKPGADLELLGLLKKPARPPR
jgi:hypothetical protein